MLRRIHRHVLRTVQLAILLNWELSAVPILRGNCPNVPTPANQTQTNKLCETTNEHVVLSVLCRESEATKERLLSRVAPSYDNKIVESWTGVMIFQFLSLAGRISRR